MPSRNQLLCAIVSILSIATISFGGAIGTFYTAIYKTISPADLLVCQCVANKLSCGVVVETSFVESVFTKNVFSKENIECAFKDDQFYNFIYCDFADLQTQIETHNNVVNKECLNKDKKEILTIIGIVLFIISLLLSVIGLILSILSSYFITVPVDVPAIPMAQPNIKTEHVEYNNLEIYKCECCVVCLDSFTEGQNVSLLTCGHIMCKDCFSTCRMIKNVCPQCRQPQPLSTSRTTTWNPQTTQPVITDTVVEIDLDNLKPESSVPALVSSESTV